jgi:hypothetical protein
MTIPYSFSSLSVKAVLRPASTLPCSTSERASFILSLMMFLQQKYRPVLHKPLYLVLRIIQKTLRIFLIIGQGSSVYVVQIVLLESIDEKGSLPFPVYEDRPESAAPSAAVLCDPYLVQTSAEIGDARSSRCPVDGIQKIVILKPFLFRPFPEPSRLERVHLQNILHCDTIVNRAIKMAPGSLDADFTEIMI